MTRGACPHDCPDTCAWTVTVRDGRAVELKGDPDHPFTRGGLCTKVNHFLEDRTYHPDRLLHPLRRTGPKGSGAFETISWDEALDAIADRLTRIVDESGGQAVMPYSYLGTQGLLQGTAMSDPFFARMGATHLERAVCGSASNAGESITIGSGAGLLPEELVHSRFIVLWGTNTVSTNLHLWPFIREAKERGATVVVIDPVKTRTAAAADRHVRPMPGTDAALALGMMHVIVAEGLHDEDYLQRYTVGFEQLAERLQEYPPERVADITRIDADEICELARGYATTRPAAIRVLVGMEHRAHGAAAFRTIACLPAVVGAWRERGGGLCHMTFQLFDELDWSCGIGIREDPSVRSVNMVQIGRALTDPSMDPPVRALVVYNSNPAAIAPNQNLVLEGLRREDLFTVVIEHVLTDTARHADYLLPATTQVEHHDVLWSWGQTYLTINEPAIDPVGEALPNTEIFRRIASRMGFDDEAFRTSDEQLVEAALAALGENRVREVRERGWIRMETEGDQLPHAEGRFATPSGRCELSSERLAAAGMDPVPGFVPATESPAGDPALVARFPLALVTAKGAHHFLNSSYGNVERALKAEKTPVLDLHPDDAAPRDIADGDIVRVFNDRGSLELPVRVGDKVRAGMVSMPSGWWASRSPTGSSANALTPDGLSDLGGGGDFHDALVEVERVSERVRATSAAPGPVGP
jgi:anaerobic selenocysteine-containing dehydrogenase